MTKWFIVLGSALLFILSDSLSANWGKNGNVWSLVIMCFVAPVGYVLFGLLNRNTSLSVSSGLVNIFLIIGTILIGIFYFDDVLTTRQSFGLIFAIIAVILLG